MSWNILGCIAQRYYWLHKVLYGLRILRIIK